uniref:Uncharacterized protein n=1 Tax=Nymphaea colorata TaxID=210225 RepID=A0A5K1CE21_9MAGN
MVVAMVKLMHYLLPPPTRMLELVMRQKKIPTISRCHLRGGQAQPFTATPLDGDAEGVVEYVACRNGLPGRHQRRKWLVVALRRGRRRSGGGVAIEKDVEQGEQYNREGDEDKQGGVHDLRARRIHVVVWGSCKSSGIAGTINEVGRRRMWKRGGRRRRPMILGRNSDTRRR